MNESFRFRIVYRSKGIHLQLFESQASSSRNLSLAMGKGKSKGNFLQKMQDKADRELAEEETKKTGSDEPVTEEEILKVKGKGDLDKSTGKIQQEDQPKAPKDKKPKADKSESSAGAHRSD